MANYIGKEPTPVPLSTADYQDGSITGVKLAPNAASTNLGFVPFNPTTGGTINGATNFANNVGVNGVTTVEDLVVNNPADFNDTVNVDGAATFTSTVGLGGDPTLPLQAATKQYVDNNFQLSTGLAGQTLTSAGVALTNASARMIEYTTVAEFATITLPDATTLTISNGKFVFHNDGANPIGVYDFTGRLIGAIGPSSTATLYLYDIATSAGSWSIVGSDVRPFFVNNTAYLPQGVTAANSTLAATDFATVVKMSANIYVVIARDTTATNNETYAHVIDTSTKPATVGARTVVSPLSTSGVTPLATVAFAYPINATNLFVGNGFNTTSFATLTLVGTTITVSAAINIGMAANPFATNNSSNSEFQAIIPLHVTTVGGINYADIFVAAIATAANVPNFFVFKFNTTITPTPAFSPAAAVINGTVVVATGAPATGAFDMRAITYDAGTGVGAVGCVHATAAAAPFGLVFNKIVVTKNAPALAPTFTVSSTTIAGTMPGQLNFGWAPNYASPNEGCVFYYQNSTLIPAYTLVSGLLPANTFASSAIVPVAAAPAGVAGGFTRQPSTGGVATGLIGNARGLLFDYWRNGSWRAYVMTATGTGFVKILSTGALTSNQFLADIAVPEGANTAASSMALIGTPSARDLYYVPDATAYTIPAVAILCSSALTPAAGANGGAKIYVCVENPGNQKIDYKDAFAPSTFVIRDSTPTLIGYQQLSTLNGFFMVPVGAATATTTTQSGFNTWAAFKLNSDGSLAYYGNWPLPMKVVNELCFNTQFIRQNTEIVTVNNATGFNLTQSVAQREFVRIDTVFE